jgi:hypothetical protein
VAHLVELSNISAFDPTPEKALSKSRHCLGRDQAILPSPPFAPTLAQRVSAARRIILRRSLWR